MFACCKGPGLYNRVFMDEDCLSMVKDNVEISLFCMFSAVVSCHTASAGGRWASRLLRLDEDMEA